MEPIIRGAVAPAGFFACMELQNIKMQNYILISSNGLKDVNFFLSSGIIASLM